MRVSRGMIGHPGKGSRVIASRPRKLQADIQSSSDEQPEVIEAFLNQYKVDKNITPS